MVQRGLSAVARLALGVWVGAIAAVSFSVAPRVFHFLDAREQAGELMAPIFRHVDLFGIGAAVLFTLAARRSRWRAILAATMAAAAAVNTFALAPRIEARDEHLQLYHRAAEGLWGFLLLAGAILLLAGSEPAPPRE